MDRDRHVERADRDPAFEVPYTLGPTASPIAGTATGGSSASFMDLPVPNAAAMRHGLFYLQVLALQPSGARLSNPLTLRVH